MPPQTNVRLAQSADIESIIALDPIAKQELSRRAFIVNAVAAGQCWAAVEADDASALIGYGAVSYTHLTLPTSDLV